MTASTDSTAGDAGPATSPPDAESARDMADQMADVAGALFALLLLQAAEKPVLAVSLDPPVSEPTEVPVTWEAPEAPVLVPSVPALAVALVEFDLDPSPDPAGVPIVAMPRSLPMPEVVPQLEAEPIPGEPASPHTVAIPVIVSGPAPSMVMLSEIEFLDE